MSVLRKPVSQSEDEKRQQRIKPSSVIIFSDTNGDVKLVPVGQLVSSKMKYCIL
jgi:hypothetical protein